MRKLIYGILGLIGVYGLLWLNVAMKTWTGFELVTWFPALFMLGGLVYLIGTAIERLLHGPKK